MQRIFETPVIMKRMETYRQKNFRNSPNNQKSNQIVSYHEINAKYFFSE